MLLIQNGRVLDPYTQMDALCDVLIGDDGVIAQVEEHIDAPAGCTVYDASGLTVSPGFVDGHVHFRDPGQTQKEDVLTGAAAAAAGGSCVCRGSRARRTADRHSSPCISGCVSCRTAWSR